MKVEMYRFVFELANNVLVGIQAESQKDAESLFCLVFGDMLFSQVKNIHHVTD